MILDIDLGSVPEWGVVVEVGFKDSVDMEGICTKESVRCLVQVLRVCLHEGNGRRWGCQQIKWGMVLQQRLLNAPSDQQKE